MTPPPPPPDGPPHPRTALTRRHVLAGGVTLTGLVATGAVAGCSDPDTTDSGRDATGGSGAGGDIAALTPATLITRWAQDPYSGGSYSYLPPGATRDDRSALAQPVGRLTLAGEHTSENHPSTVHGAIESGRRAAEWVTETLPAGSSIIVIGAGAAGLAAAREIAGDYEVTVIEARDRLGGRVFTDTSLGFPVDLGASWIHGTTGNPVTELAREFGMKLVTTDAESSITYDARTDDGRVPEVDDADLSDESDTLLEAAAQLAAQQENSSAEGPPAAPLSLADALDAAMDAADTPEGRREELRRLWITEIGHEYAADTDQLSATDWDDDESYDGPDAILPNGYGQLIEGLAKGVDVRLSARVTRIGWSDTGIDIDLAASGETLRADAAIATLPLGVLKADTITFEPPLPQAHTDAIGRLAMGVLNKVVLDFGSDTDEVFWDDEWFIDVWAPTAGDFPEFVNLAKGTGRAALMGFAAGAAALELEDAYDPDIVAGALAQLDRVYGE